MISTLRFLIVLGSLATIALGLESVEHGATMDQCKNAMNGVLPSYYPTSFTFSGNVRRYYISTEIQPWDYVPSGWDSWLGVPAEESLRMQTAGLVKSNSSLGTKYDKAVYVGYTDDTFTEKLPQPEWAGIQGPIIRAEVGDMIEILYTNKIENFTGNVHSMGLFYSKEFEGSVYPNSTSGADTCGAGDSVSFGGCFVYKWLVTDDMVPPEGQDSRLLGYHGFVSMPQDTNTGLFGANIIYRQGKMEETMAKNREFVVNYNMMDEKSSFLTPHNVKKYLPDYYKQHYSEADAAWEYPGMNYTYWNPQQQNSPSVKGLAEACGTFYNINGYVYSNNPPFEMCVDDPVIWYIYNLGDAPHAVHWHGNNVKYNGQVIPTLPTNPGEYLTAPMTAANPGVWEMLCHYTVHNVNGMEGLYHVYKREDCPLTPLSTNDKKRTSQKKK